MNYNQKTILETFDNAKEEGVYHYLGHNTMSYIDSRLKAYRNEDCWAVVVDLFIFDDSGVESGYETLQNWIYLYGNCLKNKNNYDVETIRHGEGKEDILIFVDEDRESEGYYMNTETKEFEIRGHKINVDLSPGIFEKKEIELEEDPLIGAWEFLRTLTPEHKDHLMASEEEIRQFIPDDLPLVLTLEEWHHTDKGKPSESETIQLLAKVLASGDLDEYAPGPKANTHWKHWPLTF